MTAPETLFDLTYTCPCGCTWHLQGRHTCDDRCPVCRKTCAPAEIRDAE